MMDDALEQLLPDDWEADNELLTCPHDDVIELDGACPQGCISPLRAMGLI